MMTKYELLSSTRKKLIGLEKIKVITDINALKRSGNAKQLHTNSDFSFSGFCGKNLINDIWVPAVASMSIIE